MQTWLMVAIALGMLAVILFTGRAEPPPRTAAVPTSAPPQPNTDRVRDYQDRLRILESRAAQEARADALAQPQAPALTRDDPPPVRSEDPLVSERKRRDYESLFASNVVLSRRPESQRPDSLAEYEWELDYTTGIGKLRTDDELRAVLLEEYAAWLKECGDIDDDDEADTPTRKPRRQKVAK